MLKFQVLFFPFIKDARIPSGCPSFVTSSPDNVDMERLKRDIPKFLVNSRVTTCDDKKWWAKFFQEEHETYSGVQPTSTTWLLDDLKLVKSRQTARNPVQSDDVIAASTPSVSGKGVCSEESPIPVDSLMPQNVSQEVAAMVQAQLEDIPEVFSFKHIVVKLQTTSFV